MARRTGIHLELHILLDTGFVVPLTEDRRAVSVLTTIASPNDDEFAVAR